MIAIAVVVWREAVEALLVVGILHAWLDRSADDKASRKARLALWLGVLSGLVLAAGLGFLLLDSGNILGDDSGDYFQAAMTLVASALILQTVAWSRRRAGAWGTAPANRPFPRSNWWSIGGLAALAVAREGSETVVFLYGSVAGRGADAVLGEILAAGLGLLAAFATYGLIQLGSKVISWRIFFGVTEILLLLLAAALAMTGLDRLVGLGLMPQPGPVLWDTSGLLDDGTPLGAAVASLTGYRATPDLTQALVYVGFWVVAWLVLGPRAGSGGRWVREHP